MARHKMTSTEKFLKKQIDNRKHTAHLLEMSYNEVLEKDIPEPAYIFEVGDRIVYGAWDYTEILDVFQNGKFYKCYSCTVSRNTNKGDVWNEKVHYLPWFEAGVYRTSDEVATIDRLEEDRDIFFNYMQRDMMSLLSMMSNKHGIDLDPEYQRGNVWSLEQKVNLVDSIFKNVDIGKFAIIKRPWGDNPNKPLTPKLYEMLDGKQRLTAIWEYYCGRFKYKGKYFYELHPRDQSHFKHYTISYAETKPLTKEQTYRYFLKLNTTGTPVDPEHIAKVRKMWLDSKLNS
jgi:hypothetical protein